VAPVLPWDDPHALDEASTALRGGAAVVLPTDTVYGVAALPDAIDVLFVLKGRPESTPIAILIDSREQADGLVRMSSRARRLASALWPGPLTIVLPRLDGSGTLGVRCPDHAFTRALAANVGPMAVTSANRHGEPTPATATEAAASLRGDVALVVDGGRLDGTASTVVDATGTDLTILREGPISRETIRAVALR
jgi:L-threonylcarbamoyladenylate synthase